MREMGSLVGLVLVALSGSALAQQEAPAGDAAAAPTGDTAAAPASDTAAAPADDSAPTLPPTLPASPMPTPPLGSTYVSRGLTIGAGALQVTLPVVTYLSEGTILKPVWIPLELRFGLTDRLDVVLSHNAFGLLPPGFRSGGVCVGGEDRDCQTVYDNFNLGTELSFLKQGGIELAGMGGFEFRSLDFFRLAFDLGLALKYNRGLLAIKAAAQIGVPVNKRAEQVKEFIAVPVQVALQATHGLAVFLDTGVFGPAADFRQEYAIPVGVGAAFAVMPILDVGAELMLPLMVTELEDDRAFQTRTLMVYAALRTK